MYNTAGLIPRISFRRIDCLFDALPYTMNSISRAMTDLSRGIACAMSDKLGCIACTVADFTGYIAGRMPNNSAGLFDFGACAQ
jgi:hypothetical protein